MKVVTVEIAKTVDIIALEVDPDEGVACGVMFRIRMDRLLCRLHKFL